MTTFPDIPPSLTTSFLTKVIQKHTKRSDVHITDVIMTPMPQGILSQVHRLDLTYSQTPPPPDCPVTLLSKRPHQPYVSVVNNMFSVESHFYNNHATNLRDKIFFGIPIAYYASCDLILLEFIPQAVCHPLSKGCPPSKLSLLISNLATLHASQWDEGRLQERSPSPSPSSSSSTFDDLARPAGMGALLPPDQKSKLFVDQYSHFLTLLSHRVDNVKECYRLCDTLSTRGARWLSMVHDTVYRATWTLIHGDYHVANWLFCDDNDNVDDGNHGPSSWLIDWGSSGEGNPLIDVAFFVLVGTREEPDVVARNLESILKEYYRVLVDPRTSENGNRIRQVLSWEQCRDMFRLCLLNQLLIFVAYDPLVRKLAQEADDEEERRERMLHFDKVHAKAIIVMLCPFVDWEELIMKDFSTFDIYGNPADNGC